MNTSTQIRELLTTYQLEESVLNLREHDRLMVRQRLGKSEFQATLTSGQGGISLILDAREESDWHRVELLALARHAPRLMASAISTSNFQSLLRDPACQLAYVAQSAKDMDIPALLGKHVRSQDLLGTHLKGGVAQVEDWGIPRENIQIPVFDSKVKADNCMCTLRFQDETLLGCLWQSRATYQHDSHAYVIDAFAEADVPLVSHARKTRVPEWATIEIREIQRPHQWKHDDAEVEIWLERIVDIS